MSFALGVIPGRGKSGLRTCQRARNRYARRAWWMRRAATGGCMSPSERACGPIPVGSCGLLLPQRRQLRGDNVLIRHVAAENADVAGKLVHTGDERPRNGWIIIRKIATDELGNELGLGRGKKLSADLRRACRIRLQLRMRAHN